jgi:lipase
MTCRAAPAEARAGGAWRQLTAALSEQFHIFRIDLPGMGDSSDMPIERVWDVEDDARAVAAILDVLKQPVHFVGHSAGCVFSWPALAAVPDQIRSLTLFEPVFFELIEDDPTYSFPKETAEGYVRLADAGDMEAAMAYFVDRWAGREGAWAAMPEKVRALMRKGGARLRHEWFSGFYPRDRASWLKELAGVPTLLVEGQATVPAAARVCDRFAELRPGVTRLSVPGAGHMVPFTHASYVVSPVEAHLGAN